MSLREDNERAARVPPGQWGAYLMGEYRLPPVPEPIDPTAQKITDNYRWIVERGD